MKHVIIVLMFLLPAASFAGEYYQPVPMAEVVRLMNAPGVVLLDVNVQEVWEKHHIPGAVHVASPDLARYLPTDRQAVLIFYCAGPLCEASGIAANQSVLLGFRRVYVMRDGIFAWVKAGYPVESTSPGNDDGRGQR